MLLLALSWNVRAAPGPSGADAWGSHALSLLQSESFAYLMRALHEVQGWFDAVVVAGAMAVLAWRKRWSTFTWFVLAVPCGMLAASGLKLLVQRPRPDLIPAAVGAHGFAFPSGHVAAASLLFGYLVWQVFEHTPHHSPRLAACLAALTVVSAVGCSRVYLGVHLPSDVLASVLLAITWLGLCIGARQLWRGELASVPA